MDKQTLLQQWKEMADSDLIFADFSSKNMWPIPYAIVCFHCQQAVEKYLKWFLVLNDIDPPKIHELEELEKLCEKFNPQFESLYKKCSVLTQYAVQTRYPNEKRLEKLDMDKALEYAKQIREFMHSLFPDVFEELKIASDQQ